MSQPYNYQSDKWDEWMQEALQGNKQSYNALLTHLHPWLCAYFGKRLNDEAAYDLAQETLLSLHAKRHTYDPSKPFGPWISAVARYRLIDFVRKKKQQAETVLNDDYHGKQDSEAENIGHKQDVEKLMKHLTKEQAYLINLVKLQEFSIRETAERTGRSESSVKVMIHRAIKKMASMHQKEEASK
jgi:RNA polymerase sigma-70 factor (ECF subfamily)